MFIRFENALVLETRAGISKSGNNFCTLRFLDRDSLQVYDLVQFGDAASVAAGLGSGVTYSLDFELNAGRDGGVRCSLVGMERVQVD